MVIYAKEGNLMAIIILIGKVFVPEMVTGAAGWAKAPGVNAVGNLRLVVQLCSLIHPE